MKKWVLPRHAVVFAVLRFILSPFMMLIFGFRYRKCRMQKDRPYLLLCNHQSFWDPFFIAMFTNRPIHFMATDNIFSNGFLSGESAFTLNNRLQLTDGAERALAVNEIG